MDKNKPNNEPWLKCKPKRKLEHHYNFGHITEVKRVGVRGLMLNEIKYDDKKQQGVRLKMNKCQEELHL
jgi:hypothetical protein